MKCAVVEARCTCEELAVVLVIVESSDVGDETGFSGGAWPEDLHVLEVPVGVCGG